jgi:peptide deformylase
MRELKILINDTPQNIAILNRPAKRVKNAHATDIIFLMQTMKRICESPNVAGVAATQLGKPVRIFALHIDKTKPCKFYINPKIVAMSDETFEDIEGCLSVPGKQGYVERSRVVSLKYEDRNGNQKTEVFNDPTGFSAKAVQHEMDHLDGVLYIDRTDKIYSDEQMQKSFDEAKQKEQSAVK